MTDSGHCVVPERSFTTRHALSVNDCSGDSSGVSFQANMYLGSRHHNDALGTDANNEWSRMSARLMFASH